MKAHSKQLVFIVVCVAVLGVLAAWVTDDYSANPAKYTLYCGLNDADSGAQKLSVEQAQQLARGIIGAKGCSYTEYVAYGGTENGCDTLVYELFFTHSDTVIEIAKAIRAELNIAPVLMEKGTTDYRIA